MDEEQEEFGVLLQGGGRRPDPEHVTRESGRLVGVI